jgi:hypothetical protein
LRVKLLVACLAASLLGCASLAIAGKRVDALSIRFDGNSHSTLQYRDAVVAAAEQSGIDVLAPKRLRFAKSRGFKRNFVATSTSSRHAWEVDFASAPNCGTTTACFLGELSGGRGPLPSAGFETVELTGGTRGEFRGVSCGGSCAPATILFKVSGILYVIQNATPPGDPGSARERRVMINMANSAISAGPR